MVYQYIACKEDGNVVKGKLTAVSEDTALNLLDYAGYRVISLQIFAPFLSLDKILNYFSKVKPTDIILLFRQLALLLESGMDIISSLEILRAQAGSRLMKNLYSDIVADLRAGQPLSKAMEKHPKVFSPLCRQSLRVGEQSGSLEVILRQMADYMQKEMNAGKSIKGAMTYPIIAAVVTVIVTVILVVFVLPTFGKLYSSMGAKLPAITRDMLALSAWVKKFGVYAFLFISSLVITAVVYFRTPKGKIICDRVVLKLPVIGRIVHLKELSRICRTVALLFRSGLPLTEIMTLVINSTGNRAIVEALNGVRKDMLKGEGLAKPMIKNRLFLPMMTQMVKVGEETGNLDLTLLAVAESYEAEVKDKTDALVAMIQPAMTIVIGLIVGLVALSMFSAMYSIYGQGIM